MDLPLSDLQRYADDFGIWTLLTIRDLLALESDDAEPPDDEGRCAKKARHRLGALCKYIPLWCGIDTTTDDGTGFTGWRDARHALIRAGAAMADAARQPPGLQISPEVQLLEIRQSLQRLYDVAQRCAGLMDMHFDPPSPDTRF